MAVELVVSAFHKSKFNYRNRSIYMEIFLCLFHNGLARLFTSTYYASKQSLRGEQTFIECSFFQVSSHPINFRTWFNTWGSFVYSRRHWSKRRKYFCYMAHQYHAWWERELEESKVNTRDKVATLKERYDGEEIFSLQVKVKLYSTDVLTEISRC